MLCGITITKERKRLKEFLIIKICQNKIGPKNLIQINNFVIVMRFDSVHMSLLECNPYLNIKNELQKYQKHELQRSKSQSLQFPTLNFSEHS